MTSAETKVSIETLRGLLRLDPDTGLLYWRQRQPSHFTASATKSAYHLCANWNSRYAGKRALTCADGSGHLVGRIFDALFYAHRVVFALSTGNWPEHSIDHINGAPADNRPANLRDVTHRENHRNQALRKNSTAGVLGVSMNKRLGKWMAHITVDGTSRHLGFHVQKADAIAARRQAEVAFGFHQNHGRTSNANS